MFDKRELRRRNKTAYEERLALWRQTRMAEAVTPGPEAASSRVRVYMRKRPLFEHEEQAEEYDVVTVRGGIQVVVHNCLTKADLRTLYISHMGFQFAQAFDEGANDDDVYMQCAAPAVEHMLGGKVATLFMFGQTGSGKTHTMQGLIARASSHLFAEGDATSPCTLTAFEIAGKTMRDLLDSDPQHELKVMDDKGNKTRVLGARSCEASSPQELMELIAAAQGQRATRATQANDTSSRSHAVYQISRPGGAALTLVDCAGSERREDTTQHDAQQQKEAAEINATIFALKECFRVMRSSKGQQPPYRSSLLTRVLSDSFASSEAMIVAIGTVSPSAADTEHSVSTLRSLQELQGTRQAFEEKEDIVKQKKVEAHPRTWTEAAVKQWMEAAAGGDAKCHVDNLSKGTDGKNLIRWPLARFSQLCGGDAALGQKLYDELRLKMRSPAGGGGA
eukprot:gb/GFBE01039589.1/.p1 GENE.gb/GFBE01039589.1/~~gb/GFBE01039589.1/.p1  ORF type:complete len:449 (+),score=133.21 gb/GFBE01039589.1/:1-1347(+)